MALCSGGSGQASLRRGGAWQRCATHCGTAPAAASATRRLSLAANGVALSRHAGVMHSCFGLRDVPHVILLFMKTVQAHPGRTPKLS